ncbi:stage II sporulation protein R [Fictibacillus macauensis ZFHKF-1]|uniref:Stage II sporulation protein R n=1 Tax=Fictibacillus macauensis ZFHKF-1 TaxID=1196324 RepID=I8UA78_9BACL|nr:stage II sporulation protein R [Fictibacillus macauensis]EIT83850.1 stage II sporulation protein R [Fictibacillus macauensis ZFHKF-1]
MKRMKRWSFLCIILSLAGMVLLFETETKIANATLNESVKIPKDAIRLRILANSDEEKDQAVKRKIRDKVNEQITTWVAGLKDHDQAEKVIQAHLPEVRKVVATYLQEAGLDIPYKVTFGDVAFPTKVYGNYVYPAGSYEAVLITLGKGEGANWWCVLFPPLCFLDFENGDAVKTNQDSEKELAATSDYSETYVPQSDPEPAQKDVKVKFFLGDVFQSVAKSVSNFFS